MRAKPDVLLLKAYREQPLFAEVLPIVEPFEVGARFAEKFKLHLLEFAYTEDKVSGRDFVSERLSYLPHSEGHAHTRRTLHVLEVDENSLAGFGAQVHGIYRVFGNALKGLEHEIELSYRGKVALAAGGANYFVFCNKGLHGVIVHGLNFYVHAVFFAVVLNQVVRSVPRLAVPAVHKGVGKAAYMARGLPCARVHEYCAVEPRVVNVLLNKLFPPCSLYIVLEFHAEGAVVPRVGKSAVNFAAGEDETSVLAEGNKLFLRNGSLFVSHKFKFSCNLLRRAAVVFKLQINFSKKVFSSQAFARLGTFLHAFLPSVPFCSPKNL